MSSVVAERYQLGDVLAEGTESTVYEALDLHLQRPVTLKMLNPEYSGDLDQVQRFLDDARASASFTHTNVVSTYDVGVTRDGVPYSVTEHVEGQTLKVLVRNEAPFKSDQIRHIGSQAIAALEYAQRHDGIDYAIFPEDVLVTWGDRVKVARFRRLPEHTYDGFGSVDGVDSDPGVSIAGWGKAEGSVGVVSAAYLLYEMATGRSPGRSNAVQSSGSRATRPSSLNPSLSPTLERVIMAALETGPARRYRSVSDLGLALRLRDSLDLDATQVVPRVAAGLPRVESPLHPERREGGHGWMAVIVPTIILALLLVGAVAAAALLRPGAALPSVAGFSSGTDGTNPRDERTAQLQAADLNRAISTVKGNTQQIGGMLGTVREKLAAETSVVNGMKSLVDEMKRDATSAPPNPVLLASLAAKRQSFDLSYRSLESARSGFDSSSRELESRINAADADVGKAQNAAQQLQQTLAGLPSQTTVRPGPGDEAAAIADYYSAAQSARQEIASMRKTDDDLLSAANSLRDQADAAASMQIAPRSTAASSSAAPIPTQGATPFATPTAGSTLATPAPGPSATPVRPAPRPTAPPLPPSTRTYPVASSFSALVGRISAQVGRPLEQPRTDPATGDVYQKTSGGMLVWKKATSLAYFTDGFVTWVIGPDGLQSRPNDQQFDWEKALAAQSGG